MQRKREKFLRWYQDYEPPTLAGLSISAANKKVGRRKLHRGDLEAVPQGLPLTKGRIHFIRQVSLTGEIEILKERWKVGRKFAHRYVRATINTGEKSWLVFYRASEKADGKLIKEYAYETGEKVVALQACYRRRTNAIKTRNSF